MSLSPFTVFLLVAAVIVGFPWGLTVWGAALALELLIRGAAEE